MQQSTQRSIEMALSIDKIKDGLEKVVKIFPRYNFVTKNDVFSTYRISGIDGLLTGGVMNITLTKIDENNTKFVIETNQLSGSTTSTALLGRIQDIFLGLLSEAITDSDFEQKNTIKKPITGAKAIVGAIVFVIIIACMLMLINGCKKEETVTPATNPTASSRNTISYTTTDSKTGTSVIKKDTLISIPILEKDSTFKNIIVHKSSSYEYGEQLNIGIYCKLLIRAKTISTGSYSLGATVQTYNFIQKDSSYVLHCPYALIGGNSTTGTNIGYVNITSIGDGKVAGEFNFSAKHSQDDGYTKCSGSFSTAYQDFRK